MARRKMNQNVAYARNTESGCKYGKERSIVRDCTHEEKINFKGFTKNRLLWQPATPFTESFI